MTRLVGHYHLSPSLSRARAHARRAAFLSAFGLIGASLSACAVSMPIATLSASNEDVTGSIRPSALEQLLDAEDWRRARAALSVALDPQGPGTEVGWDNPQSAGRGSFSPTGQPYPVDARICRAFRAELQRKAVARTMDGVACVDKGGEWAISTIGPVRKV